MVTPYIKKQTTVMRVPISPHERLSAYFKFVAEGNTLSSLARNVNISQPAMSKIMWEVSIALNHVLRGSIKLPMNANDWLIENMKISMKIDCAFPGALGFIDGKHIRIQKPKKSGSSFFCHKKFFSIILLAVVGADRKFLYVNVGANGVQMHF
uniref:Uncharacterized protein LOC113799126 n=1 Tax=Dermatophagoides pteronyssinus TaxID=6956 RepID=A0A6P6YL84_DERPT|nr:uncharacterized protein LOC113799126 [Dermatophagoides pteronyssinus]